MKNIETFVLYLAGFLVLAFTATVGLLLFHAVPASNKDMVNIFLGIEGSSVTGVIGYYFGSSKGSAAKDITISNLTPTEPSKPQ
jgi:hypothetical protein